MEQGSGVGEKYGIWNIELEYKLINACKVFINLFGYNTRVNTNIYTDYLQEKEVILKYL